MNNYIGIDYGLGETNIDKETGIRYGVIGYNSISSEAFFEEVIYNGRNLSYENFLKESTEEITTKLEEVLRDYLYGGDPEWIVNHIKENIEESLSEQYEENDDCYLYEKDGYIIETTDLGLYILKSPFITFTQFCSPCCPGAGNLDFPIKGGVPTYCLGEDWFDEHSPCPYNFIRTEDYLKEKYYEKI